MSHLTSRHPSERLLEAAGRNFFALRAHFHLIEIPKGNSMKAFRWHGATGIVDFAREESSGGSRRSVKAKARTA